MKLTKLFANLRAGHAPTLAAQRIAPLHGGGAAGWYELLYRPAYPQPVSPEPVIRLAEQSGRAVELDLAIVRAGVEWLAMQPAATRAAINVTPSGLATAGFAEDVLGALRSQSVAPDRVLIEVSERRPVDMCPGSVANLTLLAGAGVGLCLDDVGAAFANLQIITAFPLAALKVDRGLVRAAIDHDRVRGATVLAGLAAFAGAVGTELVLEGVETPGDAARLREIPGLRHAYVQGWAVEHPWVVEVERVEVA